MNPLKTTSGEQKTFINIDGLEYINRIMEKINSTHDLNIVARDIVDLMVDALDCIGGALFIVDQEANALRAYDYSRTSLWIEKVIPILPKEFKDYYFELEESQSLTVRTVNEKKIFTGNNCEHFFMPVLSKFISNALQRAVGLKTITTAPTIINDKVVGLLMVGFREKELPQEKIGLLELFSNQCAVAINNAQKYERLQNQYKEMQEILAQQSDFIATSNHEFRTPLSIALFQTHDLVETLEKSGLKEARDEAGLVVQSLERLQAIMEKIFIVQAYDGKKVELQRLSVSLNDFCAVIYHKFNTLMKEKGLIWKVENETLKNPVFNMDAQQIEKMLVELVTNALNFTPKGGKVILKAWNDKDGNLLFKVTDTGEGIPKKEKENIFKKFKGNHSMQSMGIGLGLYIAKKVVELHGGEIWVEDTSRGGATFIAKLLKYEEGVNKRSNDYKG